MAEILSIGQPRRLSRDQFKSEVQKLLQIGDPRIQRHLNRDHPDRRISPADIKRCLEKGTVQSDPVLNIYGNWQAEMFRHAAGERLTVVTAIEWEQRVIVITAY
jgi:hypothetical protein